MKILMKLERETKGALRYQEVDDNMNVVDIPQGAKLGMMYIRKSAFFDVGKMYTTDIPTLIQVQIEVVEC